MARALVSLCLPGTATALVVLAEGGLLWQGTPLDQSGDTAASFDELATPLSSTFTPLPSSTAPPFLSPAVAFKYLRQCGSIAALTCICEAVCVAPPAELKAAGVSVLAPLMRACVTFLQLLAEQVR